MRACAAAELVSGQTAEATRHVRKADSGAREQFHGTCATPRLAQEALQRTHKTYARNARQHADSRKRRTAKRKNPLPRKSHGHTQDSRKASNVWDMRVGQGPQLRSKRLALVNSS